MTNVFIDTNIFVRIATQGRPGCEQKHFEDLRTLVEERAFRLLVPEVVSLELEKVFRSLPKSLESACDKVSDAVGKATQDCKFSITP
jgi:predicted nucleic acid-binding protein